MRKCSLYGMPFENFSAKTSKPCSLVGGAHQPHIQLVPDIEKPLSLNESNLKIVTAQCKVCLEQLHV